MLANLIIGEQNIYMATVRGNQLQPTRLSLSGDLARLGMSDAERVQQLLQTPDIIPPRHIVVDEALDPCGLLEQRDTYEVLAGVIFQECEGIFRQSVLGSPEVGQQYRQARKKPAKPSVITLPTVSLTEFYSYEMLRATDATSTQYLFRRADEGHEESGFRVIKQDGERFVLKNINPDESDITDEAYYLLLHNAQKWIQNYGAGLNIQPSTLRNLASLDIEPPKLRARAAHAGAMALHGASEAAWRVAALVVFAGEKIFTYETGDRNRGGTVRHPRLAALAVTAALIPVPGHGVGGVGEVVWDGTEAVATTTASLVTGTYDVINGYLDAIHDTYTHDDSYDRPNNTNVGETK